MMERLEPVDYFCWSSYSSSHFMQVIFYLANIKSMISLRQHLKNHPLSPPLFVVT